MNTMWTTDPGHRAPRRLDYVLVVLLAALCIVETAVDPQNLWGMRLSVGLLACAALPMRRLWPLATVAALFSYGTAFELVSASPDEPIYQLAGSGIAAALLVYALARWAEPRQVLLGLAVVATATVIGETADGGGFFSDLGNVIPWIVFALAGAVMRYRSNLANARLEQARLAERNALARDLHDTVAHHVSAIAVQAQAAQFVAKSDPDAAMEAVRQIEETANRTIDEMRQMVGILRSDDDIARTVTKRSLVALVDPDAAPTINLTGETDLSALSPHVASALYRIAQESITNATKHNRGVTKITVDLQLGKEAVLNVSNDGAPVAATPGGGFGIVGMAERVESLGGILEAGPRPVGGWKVQARIPSRGAP